ncbi:hypothetical protein J3D45_002355 [Microbacterium foliorum]|uniref:hypothetical protein n=1 Tax=Microbacterium foliorum TaxID=104336 RepID=UPI0020A10A5A|nr:hypothetical protein [Microbacterium foliorum]MCP1429857.1 hypothetical protein [Microbacterium foliorum]
MTLRDDFLRPPRTAAEWAADALRVIGVVAVGVAAIVLAPTDVGITALALPALMLPRMLGLRGWFDLTTCVLVLAAAWSNVFDLYRSVPGWDLLLHFACTGVLAVIAAVVLTRARIAPITRGDAVSARTPLVLLPLTALALSAVWEMVEWLGLTYLSDEIFVTYQDTIGDMVFGGLGGLVAGLALVFAPVERAAREASDAGMVASAVMRE